MSIDFMANLTAIVPHLAHTTSQGSATTTITIITITTACIITKDYDRHVGQSDALPASPPRNRIGWLRLVCLPARTRH
ncbi:hypothetical protein CGRA01v4_10620 [Colletotrichum graminicola]|nr:hypothetical protein CGRA01v4_10620 [Colletotrichum graminicola]